MASGELARLTVRIGADISDFQKNMSAVQRATMDLSGRMREVGKTMTAGLTLPILALGGVAVKAAADMDSLQRGLVAVAGSSEAAQAQLARLKEVAKLPGLGLQEAVRGSIALQAAGFNAQMAERSLKAFGNALATVGKGREELDGVILALGQIQSKGKVSAEEINQLAERVPQIRQAMIAAFGTADTEIFQKAKISATDFVDGVLTELEKLPPVTGGVQNDFENMTDALNQAAASIGNALLPVVTPLVQGIAAAADQVRALNPEVVKWGIAIAGVAAVAGPLIVIIGGLATAATAVATAFSIGLLPVIAIGGPIVLALAALSAVFIKTKLDALEAGAAAKKAADDYAAAVAKMDRAAVSSNLGQLGHEYEVVAEQIRAKEAELAKARRGRAQMSQTAALQVAPLERELALLRAQNAQRLAASRILQERRAGIAAEEAANAKAAADAKARADELRRLAEEAGKNAKGPRGKTGAELLDDEINLLTDLADLRALTADEQTRMVSLEAQLTRELDSGNVSAARRLDLLRQTAKLRDAAGNYLPTIDVRGVQVGVGIQGTAAAPEFSGAMGDGTGLSREMGGATVAAAENIVAAGDAMAYAGRSVLSNFTPLGMASAALSGLFEGLQPIIDAVQEPLRMVGMLLGQTLAPALQMAFPLFKGFAIGLSYVSTALGWLVRGIGKLIDKIPGISGGPLIRAGQSIMDAAERTRKELKNLSFTDAVKKVTEGVEKFGAAVRGLPDFYKLEAARFGAISPVSPASSTARSGGVTQDNRVTLEAGAITVVSGGTGESGEQLLTKIETAVQSRIQRGAPVLLAPAV